MRSVEGSQVGRGARNRDEGAHPRSGVLGVVLRVGVKGAVPNEGGLPKPAVPEALVTRDGLRGDYNHYRQEELHGDPDSAVLLLPQETIDELNRDGWPVAPGDFGENFTMRGVPPASLGPGLSLSIGAAEVTISRRCDPCRNLFALPYVGNEKGPGFLRATLIRRGWYARVVREGIVRVGDPIRSANGAPPPGPNRSGPGRA
jgi:MOSC domain-containing protein YiiM